MLLWSRVRFIGLLMAAISGALSWSVDRFELFGGTASVGFLMALWAELVILRLRPERRWYDGRAIAESIKTLVWRYSVGGEPFSVSVPQSEAIKLFAIRVRSLLQEFGKGLGEPIHGAVTNASMETVRTLPFEVRREVYIKARVAGQTEWYSERGDFHRRSVARWRYLLVLGEVAALFLAALRFSGVLYIDFAGILAAAVSAGAAWIGIRQHESLSAAYSVAAQELSISSSLLSVTTEGEWSTAVSDTERAISREHTTWLASRTGIDVQADKSS